MPLIRRRLGETDLTVSPVGLGCDFMGTRLDDALSFAILDRYADRGGNFLDTAAVYGRWVEGAENASERTLGRWLRRRPHSGEIVVATKGGHYDLSAPAVSRVDRREIARDIEDSLAALGLDAIDLYWLHRDDPARPIEEILSWMEDFVREGKIRFYAASNFTAARLRQAYAAAARHGWQGFSAVSDMYSPASLTDAGRAAMDPTLVVTGEAELAFHRETGTPLIPYASTAHGWFARMASGADVSPSLAKSYDTPHNRAMLRRLTEEAKREGFDVQTAVLAECMRQPFQVIPLTSVSRAEQLDALAPLLCGGYVP
ncbi:MAG: aldo/keto reductase [Clostridia bacterium]|nr:aldo/keto reductase [Clostridia bacterium]